MRESAVAAAREGLAAGRSLASLAAEMALPPTTLQRWLARPGAAFRPVAVAAQRATPSALTLRTPQGHAIEGLEVATAAALLRALEERR